MNKDDLDEKHQKQLGDFEVQKVEAWLKVKDYNDQMRAAFNDNEADIPDSVRERDALNREEYREEWASDGKRIAEIKKQQQLERENRDKIEELKKQFISAGQRNKPHDKDID